MNEAHIESLYQDLASGCADALPALLSALTDADDFIRDAAAWSLVELIDTNALTADQVQAVRAADWTRLDARYERQYLASAVTNFTRRQPQPCPDCNRLNCCRVQRDVDFWYCTPGMLEGIDADD